MPETSDLSNSFDSPSDDEDDDDRDMRNVHSSQNANFPQESVPLVAQARTTGAPSGVSAGRGVTSSRTVGGGQTDGVFANLSAKPTAGEKLDEHPPVCGYVEIYVHCANSRQTYEQAAADATPPYWETTILAPGLASDEVFIDGLPVGSVFAFVWNALSMFYLDSKMINVADCIAVSMSFQLVGFLLTYLLHTTHAAKNGSRAGLGITLVQFGFMMRGKSDDLLDSAPPETEPPEPNNYEFQGAPDIVTDGTDSTAGIGRNEWLSYILMVIGWFILIRAVSDFLRARRTEQVVLASPDRGLGVAVVAEDEDPERAV